MGTVVQMQALMGLVVIPYIRLGSFNTMLSERRQEIVSLERIPIRWKRIGGLDPRSVLVGFLASLQSAALIDLISPA
ncbi:MAG: hypothetical protein KDJ45_12460 [Hyphomicrobiaceae bacterium]|nr:hypothetical protein [Hyphomicrobiaceae bacterium]